MQRALAMISDEDNRKSLDCCIPLRMRVTSRWTGSRCVYDVEQGRSHPALLISIMISGQWLEILLDDHCMCTMAGVRDLRNG